MLVPLARSSKVSCMLLPAAAFSRTYIPWSNPTGQSKSALGQIHGHTKVRSKVETSRTHTYTFMLLCMPIRSKALGVPPDVSGVCRKKHENRIQVESRRYYIQVSLALIAQECLECVCCNPYYEKGAAEENQPNSARRL